MPKGIPHTFETANAKMQELGNRIVKSTFVSWRKPCTIIFSDKTESTEHSPHAVDYSSYTSKPNHKGRIPHTFETANAKMQELGNRIVKSTFVSWDKPCTIIFSDKTESTKHSPCAVDAQGWTSKPKERVKEHTFETANAEMKALGNRIVKSTFVSWDKPCTIIFSDKTESTKHSPSRIHERNRKAKPGKGGPSENTKFLYIMYFILHGNTNGLKIGIAADAFIRCGTLNTGLRKGNLVTHKVFKFHSYKNCKQAEDEIKKLTRAPKSVCKHFTNGKTEVYAVDQLKPAMKIIRKHIKAGLCFEIKP